MKGLQGIPTKVHTRARICELIAGSPFLCSTPKHAVEVSTQLIRNLAGELSSGRMPIMLLDGVDELLPDQTTAVVELEGMRPPFNQMWLECRYQWGDREEDVLDLGALVEDDALERDPECRSLHFIVFGRALGPHPVRGPMCTITVETDAEGRLIEDEEGRMAMCIRCTSEEMLEHKREEMLEIARMIIRSSLKAFSLMGCSNVIFDKSKTTMDEIVSKKERSRGRHVPLQYSVLKVRIGDKWATLGDGSGTRDLPLHRVRGHFKRVHHGTGRSQVKRTFVQSYMRGKEEHGVVQHAYALDVPSAKAPKPVPPPAAR